MSVSVVSLHAKKENSIVSEPKKISKQDFRERMEFIGMDLDARESLKKISPVIEASMSQVLDAFYAKIAEWPQLEVMFKDQQHKNSAKNMQMQHWLGIASATYGDDYVRSVLTVGAVHNRIGLEPRW